MSTPRTLHITDVRRLNIVRQHLDNAPRTSSMLNMIRDMGCLQLDPISVVARSHQIVLWSRLGNYDLADLDKLLWEERSLFEYWAHAASIVLTEHYPLHKYQMDSRRNQTGDSARAKRWRKFFAEYGDLHKKVYAYIKENGATLSRDLDDYGHRTNSVWSSGRVVNHMLDYMWTMGEIMVTKREGIQRWWDITERCLPDWTPQETLTPEELTYRALPVAIRAQGVTTPKQIKYHFIRGRYPTIKTSLQQLITDGVIEPVQILDDDNSPLTGDWYMHSDDIPLLEQVQNGAWTPRTTLLSPFDNLICDRERTEQLWDFYFRIEIYVPKAKRQYGYYVLPILHGDRLIGRIDPKMDRKKNVLTINAVYAEDHAPNDTTTVNAIRESIQSLASFLGAENIVYGDVIPKGWEGIK